MKVQLAVVLLSVVVGTVYTREIPSFVTPCSLTDPNLNQCIIQLIEALRPRLAQGIPELFIPALEPLRVPVAKLDQGDFRAEFKDLDIYHVSDFKINRLEIIPSEDKLTMELEFPSLRIKSHYNISGELLVLKLSGQGPADGNFTNVKAIATVKGHRVKNGNQEFVDYDTIKLDLEVGDGHLEFKDLFKEKQDLTDAGNAIINQNIKDIIQDIKPVLVETIEQFVFDIVKQAFAHYSIDQLFKP